MAKRTTFDHEKLDVYRLAVDFARWVGELLDGPLKDCKGDSVKHLDESSRSTVRNIAERHQNTTQGTVSNGLFFRRK